MIERVVNGRNLKAKAEAMLGMIPLINDNCTYAIFDSLKDVISAFGNDISDWPEKMVALTDNPIGCVLEINVNSVDDSGFWSFPTLADLYKFVCHYVPQLDFGDYMMVIK